MLPPYIPHRHNSLSLINWKSHHFSLALTEYFPQYLPVIYNPRWHHSNPSKPYKYSFNKSSPFSNLDSTNPYSPWDKIHIPSSYHSVLPFPGNEKCFQFPKRVALSLSFVTLYTLPARNLGTFLHCLATNLHLLDTRRHVVLFQGGSKSSI